MRKIFLTSGLVVCMACPAFADLGPNGKIMTGTGAQATESNDPATCQYPTLLGYDGESTFTAQWSKAFISVYLDPNISDANGGATGVTFNTGTNNTERLYATSANMYKTQNATTQTLQDLINPNAVSPEATNTNVLQSPIPNGHTVTLAFNANLDYVNNTLNSNGNGGSTLTTGYTTSAVSGMPANSQSATRTFKGFYNEAVSEEGGALINASGIITAEGIAAATASAAGTSGSQTPVNDEITWYAHYNCATPDHNYTPTLLGYKFAGWYSDSGLTNPFSEETDWCLTLESNTAYAKWTANTGTITYTCGALPANSAGTLTGSGTSASVTYDQSVTLPTSATGCTVQGYHFAGWKCNYTLDAGTEYTGDAMNYPLAQDGQSITGGSIAHYKVAAATSAGNDANVTCIAQWAPNKIDLTWDLASTDATVTTEGGDDCTYDGGITLPQNPTRPGYEFQGWSVSNTAAN